MANPDLEQLLSPVAPAWDAGPSLEYDGDALALEHSLACAARGDVVYGEHVYPAPPVDWPQIRSDAAALLGRSKDLRFAAAWLRASLHCDGLAGLEAGLRLIEQLLSRWNTELHPRADPQDGDLTQRRHSLLAVVDPELLAAIRATAVEPASSLTVRDLEITANPEVALDHEDGVGVARVLQALIDLEQRAAGSLDAMQEVDACAQRLAREAAWLNGWPADDLEPLTRLTSVLGRAVVAAREGRPDALTAEWARRPRVETLQQAVAELERVAAWLARTDAANPARLLIERSCRLLTGQRAAHAGGPG